MEPVMVIAEAGVNHNGDPELAMHMVDQAAEAGADAVKFQTFRAESVVSADAPKAAYQESSAAGEESQLQLLQRLELDEATHRRLIARCADKGILFLSTAFDAASLNMLHGLGMSTFKIPSGEITNLPHLRHVGSLGGKVILSTGVSELEEVQAALEVLVDAGTARERITVLHANTEYPTPYQDVNLRAMVTLARELDVAVGYSDHTLGIEVPIAAVAMGATVIEKHFTLDRKLPGPDHAASLEPGELKAMVDGIRHIECALGDGRKRVSPSEAKNRGVVRRSIVAARDIAKGERFTEENLTAKRPGDGLSPMLWDQIIGTTARRAYRRDERIDA